MSNNDEWPHENEDDELAARRAATEALRNPEKFQQEHTVDADACPYSRDEIEEMKLLGVPKPDDVAWGDWVGPKTINHRRNYLVHLAAAGLTNKEICEEMGMSESRVSILLRNSDIKKAVRVKQDELWGDSSQRRFKQILNKAITAAEGILDEPTTKDSLKADIAFRFMDRALGKPKQEVAVEGNLLADFIHRLDQQKDTLPIDVTGLDSEKDAIDEYLENELPKDFVIGKRNAEEEDEDIEQ